MSFKELPGVREKGDLALDPHPLGWAMIRSLSHIPLQGGFRFGLGARLDPALVALPRIPPRGVALR